MTLFKEVLGTEDEVEDIKSLAADKLDESGGAIPVTTASTEDTTRETKKEVEFLKELDLTYRKEPQVFNSINLKTQMIMSAGHELRCDNDPNGKVLKFFNDFMENIGEIAEESTEEEILESIFRNQMKFGKYMLETVFNKAQRKIVDLALTDPASMDFARDTKGSIILDIYGKTVGFTQDLGSTVSTEVRGDPVPERVHLRQNQIFLRPQRIAYFWLYGDKLNPIGIIEPGYKSVIYKQNIQEAQANSIYARGTFPIIDYVGSPERFPTNKMIQNATQKLAKMQHNRYFAFPYWHRIEPLEVKQSDIVDNTVRGLKEEITASLGMPLAFSMGSGEATNRSTLNTQQKLLEFSLNDIVKKSIALFRKNVFKRISKQQKFITKEGKLVVPYYVWGDVAAEDKDAKAKRLADYLRYGGITPDYVMPYVIKSESLERDKELIKEQAESEKRMDEIRKNEVNKIGKNSPYKPKEEKTKKELSKPKSYNFTYSDVEEVLKRL